MLYTDFARRNGKCLKIVNANLEIDHSSGDSSEVTSGIVVDAILQIGKHQYLSNWAIANCRYDVILGTPWHVDNNVITDYGNQVLTVNGRFIPVPKSINNKVKISNIGIKNFRSFIRKHAHKRDFEVFYIREISNIHAATTKQEANLPSDMQKKKNELLRKYSSVLRDELHPGLPLER